jgi:hypothetical protein
VKGFAALAAAHKARVELEASVGLQAPTVIAEDFVRGGSPHFARRCSAKGDVLEIIRRTPGEPYAAFQDRVEGLAEASGSPRLVIGGIDPAFDPAGSLEGLIPPLIPRPSRSLLRPLRAVRSPCRMVAACINVRRKSYARRSITNG